MCRDRRLLQKGRKLRCRRWTAREKHKSVENARATGTRMSPPTPSIALPRKPGKGPLLQVRSINDQKLVRPEWSARRTRPSCRAGRLRMVTDVGCDGLSILPCSVTVPMRCLPRIGRGKAPHAKATCPLSGDRPRLCPRTSGSSCQKTNDYEHTSFLILNPTGPKPILCQKRNCPSPHSASRTTAPSIFADSLNCRSRLFDMPLFRLSGLT